jgi:hypothetical protein
MQELFFSEQEPTVEVENLAWDEKLDGSDLGDEIPEVKGEVRFNLCFVIRKT